MCNDGSDGIGATARGVDSTLRKRPALVGSVALGPCKSEGGENLRPRSKRWVESGAWLGMTVTPRRAPSSPLEGEKLRVRSMVCPLGAAGIPAPAPLAPLGICVMRRLPSRIVWVGSATVGCVVRRLPSRIVRVGSASAGAVCGIGRPPTATGRGCQSRSRGRAVPPWRAS